MREITVAQLSQLNRRVAQVAGHAAGLLDRPSAQRIADLFNDGLIFEALEWFGGAGRRRQPFRDCNRRTGYQLLRWWLSRFGMDIHATLPELRALRAGWLSTSAAEFEAWALDHMGAGVVVERGELTGGLGPVSWDSFLELLRYQENPMREMG